MVNDLGRFWDWTENPRVGGSIPPLAMSIRIKGFPVAGAVLSRAVVCVVEVLRGSWVIVREPSPRRHHRDSGDRRSGDIYAFLN
jgi:hypothetical protein